MNYISEIERSTLTLDILLLYGILNVVSVVVMVSCVVYKLKLTD